MPMASTQIAGNTPPNRIPRSANASSANPQAAIRGPAGERQPRPESVGECAANEAPKAHDQGERQQCRTGLRRGIATERIRPNGR